MLKFLIGFVCGAIASFAAVVAGEIYADNEQAKKEAW